MSDVTMEQMQEMMKQLQEQNAMLQEKLAQQVQPTQMVAASNATTALQAATPEAKKGLGLVWGSVTGAIGSVAGAVETGASALDQLAQTGLYSTVQGQIEGAQDLCKSLNIEASGPEALMAADAIVDYVTSRRRR